MIIEFFGLPGSGKSHIAEKEFGYIEKPYSTILDRIRKYSLVALYETMHPIRSAAFFIAIVRETRDNAPLLMHKLKFLYLNAEAREQAGQFKKEGVIDEGLVNYLLSLYERKISEKDVNSIVKRIPKKRMVYIINASKSVREKRMLERKRNPRSIFGESYLAERESVLEHNYEVIKGVIKKNFTYKEISND